MGGTSYRLPCIDGEKFLIECLIRLLPDLIY